MFIQFLDDAGLRWFTMVYVGSGISRFSGVPGFPRYLDFRDSLRAVICRGRDLLVFRDLSELGFVVVPDLWEPKFAGSPRFTVIPRFIGVPADVSTL